MLLLTLALATLLAQSPDPATAAPWADQFWKNLQPLCGKAFEGRVIEAPPNDTTFAGKRLVMHVRTCEPTVIRIPLHVGDDRSRTWVLSHAKNGLRLKHDHRHQDGSPDKVTQYGGDGRQDVGPERVEFPADAATVALIPEAKTNVWTIELVPGRTFVYALRREGTDRRYRLEFDLRREVPAPPAPW